MVDGDVSERRHIDIAEPKDLELRDDLRRGITRGSNHSTQEVTRDTRREQKDLVERQKTPAITSATGLRRRERRFESCRGHHL